MFCVLKSLAIFLHNPLDFRFDLNGEIKGEWSMDELVFQASNIVGTVAFAMSGFVLGVKKDLDIAGIFIVSMLTANGGGAVRDVLLGVTPAILIDTTAVWLVLAAMGFSLVFRLYRFNFESRFYFVISDSVGMVAFSIVGAWKGIDAGLSFFGVMVIAFITATGGGILRDTLINEKPAVLYSGFYGSVAVILAVGVYSVSLQGWRESSTAAIGLFVIGLAIRLCAHFYKWRLPKIKHTKDP